MSTINHLFEKQVEKTPDHTAIVFNNYSLTYTELNNHANHLALLLQQHNVGPNVIVAIACHRSCELIVSLLGILKAGGAYVPVPKTERKRLDYILEETKAQIIIVDHDELNVSKLTIRIDCQRQKEPTTKPVYTNKGSDLSLCALYIRNNGQSKRYHDGT